MPVTAPFPKPSKVIHTVVLSITGLGKVNIIICFNKHTIIAFDHEIQLSVNKLTLQQHLVSTEGSQCL